MSDWKQGDWAIYRKSKQSTRPGQRASGVVATSKGETYAYVIDKFWIVDEVRGDGILVMRTARGKRHPIASDDPNLKKPGALRRLLLRERFRAVQEHHPSSPFATGTS